MRRPIVVIVAILLCCGCKTPEPASAPVDPFFGRTRIEPPRTGSIATPRASDPYYSATAEQGAPQVAAAPRTGGNPAPSASAGWQPTESSNSPNSGLRLQNVSQPGAAPSSVPIQSQGKGDLVTVPVEARRQTPASQTASQPQETSTYDVAREMASSVYQKGKSLYQEGKAAVLANRERIVRVIEPQTEQARGAPAAAGGNSGGINSQTEPRKLSIPGQKPVNITELPEVRRSSAAAEPGRRSDKSAILLTSATEVVPSTQADPPGQYGFEPEYHWLRGRLEFSQVDQAWTLRYVPIDGTTDEFGGSVLLSNTAHLSGYERGDFVEVHGRLTSREKGDKTFAGTYEIREIRRLGK